MKKLAAFAALTLVVALTACGGSDDSATVTTSAGYTKNVALTTNPASNAAGRKPSAASPETQFTASGGCKTGYDAYVDSAKKQVFYCAANDEKTDVFFRPDKKTGNCDTNRTKVYRYLSGKVDLDVAACLRTP